ncbi:hypothetical protein AGABI1DRAFT_105434 [Agaricus bisporus var. burnettii JB137-S8]|uniref:Fungal N-terminal domain-containing protein n=1 Tax=Agaricus bisporus var. burnettii (strain JB137-S8 / ATCC MYA-4627 / FGSC 10392) TaxID=597362 RepID=K5W5L1_AGABU|nr:uncharacterized protein AGABI1DRAFT_105434 [Agaricus bisporus var. burnettii JB137-S8]EKM82074.1 hypothetical protein AGABI1DRAFT_105434 [Agaricus bisporus var. burnettii JB137-S8]
MATQQPVICTSLHLPPDLRPFLRIHEISLTVFLPNLDRLRLSLETSRNIDPEAAEIFDDTRKILREELEKVFKVLDLAQQLAEQYSKILEALSEGKPTQRPLYYVNLGAYAGRQCSEKAMKAMSVFRRELESAVSRVTATLNTKYKKGSKTMLTSIENTKSVSEILSAIDDCYELLQQCHNQFAQLATQTQDESSIDSNPPSEEETRVMRAKWQTFFDSIRGVWVHGFKIADEIQYP